MFVFNSKLVVRNMYSKNLTDQLCVVSLFRAVMSVVICPCLFSIEQVNKLMSIFTSVVKVLSKAALINMFLLKID